jgi:hypothetical protein
MDRGAEAHIRFVGWNEKKNKIQEMVDFTKGEEKLSNVPSSHASATTDFLRCQWVG